MAPLRTLPPGSALAALRRCKKETGGLVGAHRVFRFGGFYSKLLDRRILPMVVQHTFINTQSLLAIARVYPAYGRNDADTKNNPRGIEFIKNDVLPVPETPALCRTDSPCTVVGESRPATGTGPTGSSSMSARLATKSSELARGGESSWVSSKSRVERLLAACSSTAAIRVSWGTSS